MESSRTLCIAVFFVLLWSACNNDSAAPASDYASLCPRGEALEVDGQRRLALIVGVGEYRSNRVPDLAGPPNDARRIYELLTAKGGYEFPPQNVCVLLDEQATTGNFREAFRATLTERARSQDVAVLFFAGHGSQTQDIGGDEPDGWDETFLFHDARAGDVPDFSDDELNELLVGLHRKTQNVTVIFDSCNSGTATRSGSRFVARFIEPHEAGQNNFASGGDGGSGPTTPDLSGLVALTAAGDGTPALERDGKGIFTDALLAVLGQASSAPLTYAQVARQVPPLVSAGSYQIPYFQGNLQRTVFGNRGKTRPLGLDVVSIGSTLKLSGPMLPGIGKGAELRIYDGAANGDAVRDPSRSKATAVVTHATGFDVHARLSAVRRDSEPIAPGDLAVVARPADNFTKIRVRLRLGTSEPDEQRSALLADSIIGHPQAAALVELVNGGEDFEVSAQSDGRLILRGPENHVRNTFTQDDHVAPALWRHARQRALLRLHGEGGADFSDNDTLQVQLVPASEQSPCADGDWRQAPPNNDQVVPLCHSWNVKVTLSGKSGHPLLIGGAVLSADGAMFGLPRDGKTVRLQPGESFVFDDAETFRGTAPLDSVDRVLVFGTRESNPVAWHLLTQSATARDAPQAGLARALHNYFHPGIRGVAATVRDLDESTWTMSSIAVRVEANSRFLAAAADGGIRKREYTIPYFDVRPYFPDDAHSALRRVLETADNLATIAGDDGIPYKQHGWTHDSDAANLELGIDCSRGIWFAFTRAGLPYNRDNRYLYTGLMVGNKSPMRDEFDACPENEPYQTGDVLVYRSESRGDGHTVMVIDPDKRIAWGSMGWDGRAKESDYAIPPDVGVEYQRIKYKPDWSRWDRRDMTLKACWRYRRFAVEAENGLGLPGISALGSACSASTCPLPRHSGDERTARRDQSYEETIRE